MLGKRTPKDNHNESWHVDNKKLIEQEDAEIGYLEKMLKVKGDSKKKQKIHKSIDREGLGIGFMDFLDNIENVVRKEGVK